MSSGCCPVGSEPHLASTYTPRGKEEDVDGLSCYFVGTGEKAIICYYDIFGYNGGRTRLICDQLADNGYLVVLPDIYHGEAWPPDFPSTSNGLTLMEWLKKFPWQTKIKADTTKVVSAMRARGASTFACIGFCAGAYEVFNLCSDASFSCGLSMHPSVQIGSNFDETPEGLAKNIKCPQLIYSAGNDLPTYKKDGEVYTILEGKFAGQNDIREFPDMAHGWVSRGDVSVENIARDVRLSMEGAIEFLKKHM